MLYVAKRFPTANSRRIIVLFQVVTAKEYTKRCHVCIEQMECILHIVLCTYIAQVTFKVRTLLIYASNVL